MGGGVYVSDLVFSALCDYLREEMVRLAVC